MQMQSQESSNYKLENRRGVQNLPRSQDEASFCELILRLSESGI